MSRIVIATIIVIIFDKNSPTISVLCVSMYAIGHLTDHVDGFIARNFSKPNDQGFMIDAVSDKLFQAGALLPIHLYFGIPIVLLWIVLVREFIVTGLFAFIDISDEYTVKYISKFTYIFIGFIRIATLFYLSSPAIHYYFPQITSAWLLIAFSGYILAVSFSIITVFHMYKVSGEMHIR